MRLLVLLLLFPPLLAAQQPRAAHDFLKHAGDQAAPLPRRVAALQQAESAGGLEYADLAPGLDDAEPGFRVAVLKLLARLNMKEAGDDVLARLGNRSLEAQERAWLARAAAHTAEPGKAVPALVDLLEGAEGQERLAALESLSRLTGIGRAPVRLLGIGSAEQPEPGAFWRQWWSQHQQETPEQWQLSALGSEQARDRGAAARSLADAGRLDAIPALLARLRSEEASGVREALAKALARLTGRRVRYQAWAGEDPAAWQQQHDAALKSWQAWWDQGGDKPRTLAQQLEAPEPASRAEALRAVKAEAGDEAIALCIEALADPAAGVRVAALNALLRLLGFAWPLEPGGAPELRERQVARWRGWWALAREQPPAARLLGVVQEPAWVPSGWGGAETAATEAAEGAMGRRAAALRRLVTLADVDAGQAVLPLFERGVGELERSRDVPDFPGNVQLQMALLLGRAKPKGAVTILRARLGLQGDGPAVVNDPEIRAACAWALGECAPRSHAGAAADLLACLQGERRDSATVRAASAEALAKLDATEAAGKLRELLAGDSAVVVRANAAWALGALSARSKEAEREWQAALLGGLEDASAAVRRESLLALERRVGETLDFQWAGHHAADRDRRAGQLAALRLRLLR